MKPILITLVALALLCGGFFLGRKSVHCPEITEYTATDTVYVDAPPPVEVIPDGYELVPIGTKQTLAEYVATIAEYQDSLAMKPKIVVEHDTAYISVPMFDYTFTDNETYKALVRGYNVTMLHHESYEKTHYITLTKTTLPKWEITPVLGAFYSPIGIGAAAGLKVDFRAKKWQFEPSAAYGFYFDGAEVVRGPTFGVKIGYTLYAK